MVKPSRDDIKKQIEEEDKRVYGETTISGSMPDPESDDDIKDAVKDITGEEPKDGVPFSIAEEVKKDEAARRTKPKIIIDNDES